MIAFNAIYIYPRLWLFYFILIFNSVSCNQQRDKPSDDPVIEKEDLLQLNKALVKEEQEQIIEYINRYGYKMTMSQTGLHFMHIEEGNGQKAEMFSVVELKYTLNLIDGSYVYSSDSSGFLKFKIGQSDEPSGLQEGILNMKEGGKALIIVPSYLAYGLTGDGNKIGTGQPLVYNVELIKVNN